MRIELLSMWQRYKCGLRVAYNGLLVMIARNASTLEAELGSIQTVLHEYVPYTI